MRLFDFPEALSFVEVCCSSYPREILIVVLTVLSRCLNTDFIQRIFSGDNAITFMSE